MKSFFLVVLLNSIKWFDFETCQPESLPNSSFELKGARADLK